MDRTATPARVAFTGEFAVTPRPLPAYRDMFLLGDEQLTGGRVLDCPAGASPFGAQVRALGGAAVSVDPAYLDPDGLVARARADVERVLAWQRAAPDGFDWSYLGSPDRVHDLWAGAVDEFADDFALSDGRYVAAALPELPFPDDHFTLTVSGFLACTTRASAPRSARPPAPTPPLPGGDRMLVCRSRNAPQAAGEASYVAHPAARAPSPLGA